MQAKVPSAHLDEQESNNLHSLTSREWQVFLLVAQDLPNHQIADHLSLKPESVTTFRARIGEKLMISGRDALGGYARRKGALLVEIHYPP